MNLNSLCGWEDRKELAKRRECIIPDLTLYRYDGYEKIEVDEYVAIKESKCCYWVVPKNHISDKARRIYKHAVRSFAYRTKKLAIGSFKARKAWQIVHLKRQLKNAEQALKMANDGLIDDKSLWANQL